MEIIKYLSTKQAATYCGLSASYLAKLRCVGNGPVFHKRGSRVFYTMADLDFWMKEKICKSTAEYNAPSESRSL